MLNNFKDSEFTILVGGQYATDPVKVVNIEELINIYNNTAVVNLSEKLSAASKVERKKLKDISPSFLPYGNFSYRENKSIVSYNKEILAIDIDKLSSAEVSIVLNILKNRPGMIFCSISASGNGVKALFRINANHYLEDHYYILKNNVKKIAAALGVNNWKIDTTQFRLSQMFYICNNRFHFNTNPEPLLLDLDLTAIHEIKEKKEKQQKEFKPLSKEQQKKITPEQLEKIKSVLNKKLDRISKKLDPTSNNRHNQIANFRFLCQYLHYLPPPEQQNYFNACYRLVIKLYGSEQDAINSDAERSLKDIFNENNFANDNEIDFILKFS